MSFVDCFWLLSQSGCKWMPRTFNWMFAVVWRKWSSNVT
jgi:hypothetical protein